jgi:hypothetical protein
MRKKAAFGQPFAFFGAAAGAGGFGEYALE